MSITHFSPQNFHFSIAQIKQHYNSMDSSSSPKQNSKELAEEIEIPKVHLFEKPLTPSDVGKLNRLVIPKQNAEKYFPLSELISDSGENGFVLRFEDELGKLWKFRYSYWNSSQSYVLTKGWSRFVKEKKLDAGDVVLFERHKVDCDRQFIGWRRENGGAAAGATAVAPPGGAGWGCGGSEHNYRPSAGGAYQTDFIHAGRGVMHNQTTASGKNTRRQVRLFGVNLECEVEDSSSWSESSTPDGSSSSNHHQQSQEYYQGQASQHYHQYQVNYSNPHVISAASSYNNYNHHNNMDMDYSKDVNQMRYHQG